MQTPMTKGKRISKIFITSNGYSISKLKCSVDLFYNCSLENLRKNISSVCNPLSSKEEEILKEAIKR